ncbi:MAG: aldo/keto reductase [Desulfuromonas sp.]|uniref:aldo/keto reductase n=1 Tax=Desulfuromonas sp. TaxID=892 RepID=UPI000CC72D71|nr:aldo/keto reductase [Desulfuromonas sp.]PLX84106.1 MAG: aldo/keto reductase [Desulfuromonas sp.]
MTPGTEEQPKDFSSTILPTIDKPVCRMGIAGNYGLDPTDIVWAAEQGANYWLWGASFKKVTEGIKEVIRQDRDKHVVAMLGWGAFGWQVRQSVEGALRKLETDYLDVFKLSWLGKMSGYRKGVVDTLLRLKEEGKIRAIGTSIHDRRRAGRLALDSEIDLFMIRYNAKHPGAEEDIFPHLAKRNPAVVSYTALAWQQLTRPLQGVDMPPWPGAEPLAVPPLTPQLCYRFVLTNPHVHLVLTGPGNREQLKQNFATLQQGPLSPAESDWVRDYGRLVKARKKLDYVK